MSIENRSCHGHIDCLRASSKKTKRDAILRTPQRVWIYLMWYLRNMGLWGTAKFTASKIITSLIPLSRKEGKYMDKKRNSMHEEALHLRPGELVKVKSEKEIITTLDRERRHKGLQWLVGMSKCCDKKYRVLKRVETIRLEGKPETRRMKNTVLLEGAMCDGSEFYGCDRLCFYFWHEAWLRRVKEEADHSRQKGNSV